MKCPDCGYEIGESDKICKGCGQSVFNLKNKVITGSIMNRAEQKNDESIKPIVSEEQSSSQPVENKNLNQANISIYSQVSEHKEKQVKPKDVGEKYLEAYIGPNYEFIKNGGFSFCSLFLTVYYWSYRGKFKKAIKYFIIATIIMNISKLPILIERLIFRSSLAMSYDFATSLHSVVVACYGICLIIQFLGFIALFVYVIKTSIDFKGNLIKNAKEDINQIISSNKEATQEELIKQIKRKGNPSDWDLIKMIVIAVITYSALGFIEILFQL